MVSRYLGKHHNTQGELSRLSLGIISLFYCLTEGLLVPAVLVPVGDPLTSARLLMVRGLALATLSMLSGTGNAYAKLRMNGASLVASCDRVGDSAVLYMNMSTHFLSGGSGVCWAFLYGVPVGCANKRLDEPCITLNTARPSLWSCTWTHGTVKEKSAGMAGV